MNYDELLINCIKANSYPTNLDLRFNKNSGFLLDKNTLNEFLLFKEETQSEYKIELPLIPFNSNKIFFYRTNELVATLLEYINFYKNDYDNIYNNKSIDEVLLGVICSELEGTLKIEGVNTTRRQIEKIIKSNNPKNINDKIILNMKKGIDYISNTTIFNKETLKELYNILSDGCLNKDDELKDKYYRDDMVYVSNHNGCPVNKIEECMDSLLKFVNDNINSNNLYVRNLLPYIAHYYIIYIHPYFDYNGRTARMVQLWIFMLSNNLPALYLSEAINDNKNDYYKAIDETRNSRNDLTYFVTYLLKLVNLYSLVQKNMVEIKNNINNKGETISPNELHYLKRIIINKDIKWFNYKKFIEFEGLDITKQGALKILNKFENMGFILSKINSKNEKIFILNEDILKYELHKDKM